MGHRLHHPSRSVKPHRWILCRSLPLVTVSLTVAFLIALTVEPVTNAVAPNFAAKQDFATGLLPQSVAVGDLNGDGRLDLAVANGNSSTVSVLLNTTAPGAIAPSFAAKQDFSTAAVPLSVAVGDLNGDGKLDLVVTRVNSASVSVFLNTSAAGATMLSFAARQDFTTGTSPFSVALGDLNQDGSLDLAVANNGSTSVSVLLNTAAPGASTPSFAAKQDFMTGTGPRSVTLGDVNGDGLLDLAVANFSSDSVSVLLNITAPGAIAPNFSAKQDFSLVGAGPAYVVMGDLNGDGRRDLAVADANSTNVSVVLNTTAPGAALPSYAARQDFGVGSSPVSVSVGDLNGDGRIDLVATNQSSGNVSVLMNTTTPGAATPSFASKQDFVTGSTPRSVAVGELNGDGKLDLAVANFGSDTLSVLLNTTNPGPATPAFTDFQEFGTGQFPGLPSVGDLNGDGKLDLAVVDTGGVNTVSVLLNTTTPGAGTSSFAAKQDFTVSGPVLMTLGDVNLDGKLDLIVTTGSNVSVLLNTTATGTNSLSFTAPQNFATTSPPASLSAGDFNGDGKLDLATVNSSPGSVSVLLNTTAPGAAAPNFAAKQDFGLGATGSHMVAADLNLDGKLDLAVVNSFTGASVFANTVSVLINTTAAGASIPSFAAKQDVAITRPFFITAGDFNGDGKADLVITTNNSQTSVDGVSVLLNTTSPGASTVGFAGRVDINTQFPPSFVAVADLNGDGKLDLTASKPGDNSISLLLNTTPAGAATPSFTRQDLTNIPTCNVADLNWDGKPDLACNNIGPSKVWVKLNTPAIVAASGLSRQQGSASINSLIANATNYGGNGSVTVTVASANPSNGVTISNIVNTSGNITADVVAGCGATNATFTLQATDGSSTVTGTLNVAVTANTAPLLSYSSPSAVALGGSSAIPPVTASDNGTVAYVVQSVVPALATPPTVNGSGVVSITNAQPAGPHTITIRATDNCGAVTDASFTLNVSALIGLSQANYSVTEATGFITITVNRTGDLSGPVTVDYATSDAGASNVCSTLNSGLASARCDFGLVLGTLKFAAGQTQKTFVIPITQDSFTEGAETFTINLSNPGTGASLSAPASATITINDSPAPAPNANDDTDAFVRQHYRDFLAREADSSGLAFWKDNIDLCNDPTRRPAGMTVAQCKEVKRIDTSAAFFLSIEFQQTGNLVRSLYVASLDRPFTNNMPGFAEFERDRQAIANGVIVGQGNWQQTLIDNRNALLADFVMRGEFVSLYPTTDTPGQYVDKLYAHASVTPTSGERADAIAEFGGAPTAADAAARGRALLDVTQNVAFQQREANRSFVQMEYFGYLRRNPNDPPDGNFAGYNFWLNKLNAAGGNYLNSEMVKAFLSSIEYRNRFGP